MTCTCLGTASCGISWIDDACADAVRLAAVLAGGRAWVSVAVATALDPSPVATFLAAAPATRALLWQPDGWLVAAGAAAEVGATGPGRTSGLAAGQADIAARTIVRGGGPAGADPALPLWTTAWTFAEGHPPAGTWGGSLAPGCLRLPRRAWYRLADGRGWTIHSRPVAADEDPGEVARDLVGGPLEAAPRTAPAPWRRLSTDYAEQVEDAVSLIADGVMRKVVLARAVDEPVAAGDGTILARLRAADGQATVYAWDLDDGGCFVGATPEVLFAADGSHLRTMALAGTCRRTGDDAEDLALVSELLASTKQRKEHGVVVEHLAAVLRPRCAPFPIPAMPHRRDADRLLHLETLVEADLLPATWGGPAGGGPARYLDLLGGLHPTPAVCGLPTPTAAHYLARHEHLDRGLYAGALGFLTPGLARVVVPLRGGVLSADRSRARLFAGAGIIETSDPQAELAETELKLGLMRSAIAAE